MLNIPQRRPRKRALMLPILLGLTVLLFVLVLMPLRETTAPAFKVTTIPKATTTP